MTKTTKEQPKTCGECLYFLKVHEDIGSCWKEIPFWAQSDNLDQNTVGINDDGAEGCACFVSQRTSEDEN